MDGLVGDVIRFDGWGRALPAEQRLDLRPGSVFAGRYRIARLLGEGDRKRTYLADDTMIPRRVALALIKPSAADADPDGTRREAEALALAGTHDNVVTFHDCGVADGAEFLVFDYLRGGTLREHLAKRRDRGTPLSAEEVMRYGRQLARALSHVHRLGFIHRDVAPGNIWLDERLVAHLGDFDSAVSRDQAAAPAGLPPTTEAYAAPEQLAGQGFDERADLYSLGAVPYEALTGQRPGKLPSAVTARHLAGLRPDAPRSLIAALCSLLAASPADRPSSADQVLAALAGDRARSGSGADLEPWVQTLPFPLASVLWHWQGEPEPVAKVDYLLKFFEALAQFTATILVSGCGTGDLAATNAPQQLGTRDSKPLDLHIPTFGTWIMLSGSTAAAVLAVLETDSTRCRHMFAAADTDLIEALTSAGLAGIFQHARELRNARAHGGVHGTRVVAARHDELQDMLTQARSVLGWSFEPWTLLKPGPMIFSRGLFDLTATILKGPNAAFRRQQIQLTEALDAGRLYLLNDGSLHALELVPFIRVLAGNTGQDACYFYNRMDSTGARWVSYHYHAEPEIVLPDDNLAALLTALAQNSTATHPAPATQLPESP